ncbi:LysR family transcriptional regulator [Pseudomonas sp. LRF_L74]|uniref:LysR family transcriptional regulator n=1 Tax=Pseudomonas sp. LRF_L74 TaxID=3369422 RepID=UPI003F5E4640
MDLNAVHLLLKVAELRSFTLAANATGMTQSGLSRAIARLERQLGTRLLNRNTRSVSLTPDGTVLRDQCAPLLCGLEDAERTLLDRRCEPSGTLRLTAPAAFGRMIVLPLLGELHQRYPQLHIESTLSDRVVDIVEDGFDLAVRTGRIDDQGMIARPLRATRWTCVATPGYLARRGTPQNLDDLADHDCLAVRNPRDGRLVAWQFIDKGKPRDLEACGRLIFDNGDALLEAAHLGLGIAQLMDFAVAEAIADGRLVELLQPYAGRQREISIVYPPSRQRSPRLKVFADALVERWGRE